jgi:nicotinamidase-related amidase
LLDYLCLVPTALQVLDLGYHVTVVRDAVGSPSHEGHEMLMRLYDTRFTDQVETADAATTLLSWQ